MLSNPAWVTLPAMPMVPSDPPTLDWAASKARYRIFEFIYTSKETKYFTLNFIETTGMGS